MYQLPKNWLITGGCGFIGTNLIEHLLREDITRNIRVLDNLSAGSRDDLSEIGRFVEKPVSAIDRGPEGLELVVEDIKRYDTCSKCSEGIDIIVHLAANTGVGPSVADSRHDMEVNVIGTFNILESAKVKNVGKFVFASSSAPIGEIEPPINEDKAAKPISPYGASKLAGEGYCSAYFRTFQVNTVSLRFGNAYGPKSKNKGSVVAKFFKRALNGEPLEIYGDGDQTRDFIYVNDLIEAIMLSARTDIGGEIFQIATHSETTVNKIAAIIKEIVEKDINRPIEVVYGQPRLGDMKRNYSDITKAKNLLGFKPKFELRQGLIETHKYFKKQMEDSQYDSSFQGKRFTGKDGSEGVSLQRPSGYFIGTDKKRPRKICFSTGKRGGFGAITPFLKMVSENEDMELQLIVTDMHLHETFGKTANEVAKYFNISRVVDMAQVGDSHISRTRSLGRCIMGMAQAFNDLQPDVVLLLGDRSETLATAFSAVEMGIPVAHIQAGDVSGGLDDIHRHSISKLSHLHFSQTEKQGQRVLALGEEPWRVFVVGAPYVDRIVAGDYTRNPKLLSEKYGLDVEKPFFVILHHPDTYHPHESYSQMRSILNVVSKTKTPAIICYPCSDQGFQGIIDAIEENRKNSQFRIFNSIDSFDFLGLLSFTRLFIGNSSSGIIETPYFNLPFVNVGLRQNYREKGANVIDTGTTEELIRESIEKGLDSNFRNELREVPRLFGDGTSNKKIYEILHGIDINSKLFHKKVII